MEAEINYCHVRGESETVNLTIDYGQPRPPVTCPIDDDGPCTAQYIWDEHGSLLIDGPDPMLIQNTYHLALEADQDYQDGNPDTSFSGTYTFTCKRLSDYMTTLSIHGWAGCAAPKACIPCDVPDLVIDPAYTSHDECMVHQDDSHLRPGELNRDTFKCLTGNHCILSSGRCNGEANCDDSSDEVGCDTTWGLPAVLRNE